MRTKTTRTTTDVPSRDASPRGAVPFALGLGANLPRAGDSPAITLGRAIDRLETLLGRLQVGPLLRTRPVIADSSPGAQPQPHYYNTAVVGRTTLPPDGLLALAKALEHAAGRRAGERDGPRRLDIDLLLYGTTVSTRPELRLPHPRLLERRFALEPLAALAPDWSLPGGGAGLADLLADLLAGAGSQQEASTVPWPAAAFEHRPEAR